MMPVGQARMIAASHRPPDDDPTWCMVCTERGVGNNAGKVSWPCAPYSAARAALQAAGEMRPVAEDVPG